MSVPSVGHNIVIDLDKKTAQIINTKSDGSKNILTIFANSANNQDGKFDIGDDISYTDENGKRLTTAEFDTGVLANFFAIMKGKKPDELRDLKEVKMSGVTFDPIKSTENGKGLMQSSIEINNRVKQQLEQERLALQQAYASSGYNQYSTGFSPYYSGGYGTHYQQPFQTMPIGSYQNPYNSIGSYPSTTNYSTSTLPINNTYYDYSISDILRNTDYSKSPLYRKYAKNPDMLFKIMQLQQASQFNRLFNAHLNAEYNNPYTRWSAMYDFAHGDYGSLCRYNRNQAMKTNAFLYASGGMHPYNAIYQTNARQAAIRNELARMGLSMYDLDYNFW